MSRLPFLFIISGMAGFALFHAASLLSLSGWLGDDMRGPAGWFHAHLFVLGWATMLAMGAVYQLISVILQSDLYSERLGYVHYAVFTLGLAGLLFGFVRGEIYWIGAFAATAFAGILLFAWNMAATLVRASRWDAITVSAAAAVLYLVLTGLIGMAMGVNFATGWWNDLHDRLFGAHIWLGTVGWFGLLITGFSYKLLPMFYLAHHYPTSLRKAVTVLWNAGVIAGAASFLSGGGKWSVLPALLLIAAAVVLYNAHVVQIRKHRSKRSPGAGIKWSVYGNFAFGAAAVAMSACALWDPNFLSRTKSVTPAVWFYLAGWVSFTMLCYLSKIVPFLWWTRKYGNRAGEPGTPVMSDLLDDRKVNAGLAAIAVCTLLPLSGLMAGSPPIVAAGGTACSFFSVAYMMLIARVFSR
jgi:hypothetical protein